MPAQKYTGSTWLNLGALGDREIEWEVNYYPGTPDKWYMPNGDPGYPGDPPELEVLSAKCKALDLTPLLCDNQIFLDDVWAQVMADNLIGD